MTTPSLRYLAGLALEGSMREPGALRSVVAYLDSTIDDCQRGALEGDDRALFFTFLYTLKRHFDPDGDTLYQLEVKKRAQGAGAPPSPKRQRTRQFETTIAALLLDDLLADKVALKEAMWRVTEKTKVSRAEVYAARKSDLYAMLKPHFEEKRKAQASENIDCLGNFEN